VIHTRRQIGSVVQRDIDHPAAYLANTPKGMVDADGLVRIRWDFILKTEAGPQISFRAPGRPMP
jgi:hypothetical protein